ncbi:MAG: hypothetical protein H5U16_07105 [Roseovarius sp.]|nr:hypothetical protein [Roseovarius sp.]
MTDETETPAATLAAATTTADLPRRGPVLLGTMHGPESARALLRLANGEIRTVETGARIGTARLVAIGEGVVILDDRGRAERLEMPRG